jgi:hypothetical protein
MNVPTVSYYICDWGRIDADGELMRCARKYGHLHGGIDEYLKRWFLFRGRFDKAE